MTRAWVVLAVSSERQAETLGHQEAMAREDAARQGWTLERVFGRGREGVGSGKRGVRAIMVAVIAELREIQPAQRPAWLWLRRVDRAGRGRAAESLLALHEIGDLGVRIWDHDAGEVRLDTAEGEIIAALKAGLARLENEVRAKKSRAVIARWRAAGIPPGKVPYGLQRGPDQRFVAREPQAEAVREAFRLALEGAGGPSIARHLSAISAPYPYRTGERPVRWDQRRVYRLLKNRAYVGTIIDEVTFERAQRALAERSVRPAPRKYAWPLGGALRCWCGRNMVGKATGDHRFKRRYYLCPATWNHGGSVRMVRADELESAFLDLLHDVTDSPRLLTTYRGASATPSAALLDRAARAARKRLDEIDRRRTAAFDLHAAGKLRDDDLQPRLDQLAAERAAAAVEAADLDAQRGAALAAAYEVADAARELREARETWPQTHDEGRRAIATLVARILGGFCVEPDGTLSARFPEDEGGQARRRRRLRAQGAARSVLNR